MKKEHVLNVTPLFRSVGLPQDVSVVVNEHTYEVDLEEPKNNWLYPAFRAFQELNCRFAVEQKKLHTFVTVGTGPGIDAIGAQWILQPQKIVMTDVHPDVLDIARQNFIENTHITSQKNLTLLGSVCAPLREHGVVADVIYANLPNVPFTGTPARLLQNQVTSSFFDAHTVKDLPKKLAAYLLVMQYRVLQDARDCLSPGGSLLLNIGARVPHTLIERMCHDEGYACEELCVMYKVQSQPDDIIRSYAEAERAHGVEFDFYRHDQAQQVAEQYSHRVTTAELKKVLAPFRVTATEAWELYTKKAARIGHIVHVIRAVRA